LEVNKVEIEREELEILHEETLGGGGCLSATYHMMSFRLTGGEF
jgi:hypothetical protein